MRKEAQVQLRQTLPVLSAHLKNQCLIYLQLSYELQTANKYLWGTGLIKIYGQKTNKSRGQRMINVKQHLHTEKPGERLPITFMDPCCVN